jgi:transcriptional regulator with XRE-family HTH domain
MAAELGLSPSYLNHLERNQRRLTAQVLLVSPAPTKST